MASLERFLIERRKTKSNHNGRCDQKRGNYLQETMKTQIKPSKLPKSRVNAVDQVVIP